MICTAFSDLRHELFNVINYFIVNFDELTILYSQLQYYTVDSRCLKHCYLKVVSTKKKLVLTRFLILSASRIF